MRENWPKCKVLDCDKLAHMLHTGLCQMHKWRLDNYGDVNYTRPQRLCSLEGCGMPHGAHGYCKSHNRRISKGLPLEGPLRTVNPKRYLGRKLPFHPLASVRGGVSIHRVNLYESAGRPKAMACFWCAKPLCWRPTKIYEQIMVDHLDHDRHNNDPRNLVPSCNSCNAGRMLHTSPRCKRESVYSLAW